MEFSPQARIEFEESYDAQIIPSDRRYRRARRTTSADLQAMFDWAAGIPITAPPGNEIEDVEMIEIIMPKDKLPDLLHSQYEYLLGKEMEERKLRKEYPALQSAWEKYQLVLMMVK
jgi:hypothetical protein